MTAQTMLDKLAREIGVRNDNQLAIRIGVHRGDISRIRHQPGRGEGMTLGTLKKASDATGVPIGQLAEWWAEPG
jgi:hypothetical protein